MSDASSRLDDMRSEAEAAIASADDPGQLEELRVHYLGRKSELTGVLRGIRDLPPEQRGPVGQAANQVRQALEAQIAERESALQNADLERRPT
jgi:phenylalanyl-tRNA synthetase alpha chain